MAVIVYVQRMVSAIFKPLKLINKNNSLREISIKELASMHKNSA
jgi:hypothetical protein